MCSRRVGVLAVQGAFAEHTARLHQLGCETAELRQLADLAQPLDGLVLPGGESTTQAKLLRDLGLLEPLRQLVRGGLPVLGTCAGLILLAETVESTGDGRHSEQNGERNRPAPPAAAPSAATETAAAASAASAAKQQSSAPLAAAIAGASAPAPLTAPPPEPPASSVLASPHPVEGFRTLPVTVRRNGYGRQLGSFTTAAPLHVKHGERPLVPLTFIRAPRIVAMDPGVETLVALGSEPVAARFGNQIGCCFHPELNDDNALYRLFLSLFA